MGAVTRSFISLSVLILVLGYCHGHIYGEKQLLNAGGRKHVPTDSDDVKAVTKWAAHKLGGKSVSVVEAEEQIVSGTMYYIKFMMRENDKVYRCSVEVWVQVWLHRTKLMKHHCKRIRGYNFGSHTWGQ